MLLTDKQIAVAENADRLWPKIAKARNLTLTDVDRIFGWEEDTFESYLRQDLPITRDIAEQLETFYGADVGARSLPRKPDRPDFPTQKSVSFRGEFYTEDEAEEIIMDLASSLSINLRLGIASNLLQSTDAKCSPKNEEFWEWVKQRDFNNGEEEARLVRCKQTQWYVQTDRQTGEKALLIRGLNIDEDNSIQPRNQ